MINFFKFILYSLLLFLFLFNPSLIVNSVNYSINMFFNSVFPSLFPFFILVDFLISYNYIYFLESVFKFKYSHLMLLSMISGLPSNAKYIKNMLDNDNISVRDAEIMLSVSFFPNPMFVVGTVGFMFLGSVKLGVFLLISIYLSNFILYLFYYRKLGYGKCVSVNKCESFSVLLKNSILKNVETLLVILGTIIVFVILSNVIFMYFKVNPLLEGVISSFFEMTSGVRKLSFLNVSVSFKYILVSLSLMFSGLSVIFQAISILGSKDIRIGFVLKNKFILLVINFVINYFYVVFFF